MVSLKNKIVFITGASSGIGAACAEQFAAIDAKLILTARRLDRLTELAKNLQQQYHVDVLALQLDVQDKAAVKQLVEDLPQQWQAIAVLVNNAGLALSSDLIQDGDPENWDTMIDTNVKGLLYVTHAILPGMLARQHGHIINISSTAGRENYPGGNVYSATKHAVRSLTSAMRIDLLGKNIRVTDVAPGIVATEFSTVRWQDKQRADEFYASLKALHPEDIADAVVYCATRPEHVDVSEMVITPTVQASVNHIHKEGVKPKNVFDKD